MHSYHRSLSRNGILSGAVLMALVLASCVPLPPTPVAPTTGSPLAQIQTPAVAAPGQSLYADPAGRFTVPVPINWRVESAADLVVLRDPEDAIKVYVVVVPGGDAVKAIADAWAVAAPSFELTPTDTSKRPSTGGIDETAVVTYDAGDGRVVKALGQRVKDRVVVLLFDAGADAVERRNSQLGIIQTGLVIAGAERVDLTGVRPQKLTPDLLGELEGYITETMKLAQVPGAAVAVVQDGRVVYLKGFGVREMGKPDAVTPDTLMMIGSTGKTMTTMMMATLVDDGRMAWDTPAVKIMPSFAVADPQLTQQITMRNLVCACTGVPRRDMEILFNADSLTAKDIIASLADFQFFTGFGEAFQYSNQMVASGGYIAALAGSNGAADMYGAYLEQMQRRVFDPIGMSHTTFDFDKVAAAPDHATPHGANLFHEYSPLPLSAEHVLIPVTPAGVSWSTARDMARYLITELNRGVSPDGGRVVSADNLGVTWQPQVAVTADTSYGLGWFVDKYQGLSLLHHGGNTIGFTSDLAFLPGADLGIVVLANARSSNAFNQAIRYRLFELAFGQPAEHDVQFKFELESVAKEVQDLAAKVKTGADPGQAAPYRGAYTNLALGGVTLSLRDGKLMLDAGEFAVELRPQVDQAARNLFVAYGAPLAGLVFEFKPGIGAGGKPAIVLLMPPDSYTFAAK